MTNIIYNDNCLDVMKKMISEGTKVDRVITSPPYNMNNAQVDYDKSQSYKLTSKFNKYEEYGDGLSMEEYYEFQKQVIDYSLQLSDMLFYNIQMITGNKFALIDLLHTFKYKLKEIIIWDKIKFVPALNKGMLNSSFEFIFVFTNHKNYHRSFENPKFNRGTLDNIWHIRPRGNGIMKATFPVELIKKILINFTDEGDTILDPFMGSGTTAVACTQMNRNSIGIELSEKTFKAAQQRIKEEEMKFKYFGSDYSIK